MREREKCLPVQPTRAGPAPVLVQHCAAQPTAAATVFNLLPVGRRACARRTRAPPPPCLAAPSLPWAPPATPRTPRTLSLSLDPSSSSALPSSRHRTHLRAPLAVAMTTGHPLSRDRAQQLRNRAPHPQAEGNEPEDCASSPTSSSSPPAPGDRLRRFVGFRPSPRPLTFCAASL